MYQKVKRWVHKNEIIIIILIIIIIQILMQTVFSKVNVPLGCERSQSHAEQNRLMCRM